MKKPLYKHWYFWVGLIIFLVFVFPVLVSMASEFMDGYNRAESETSGDSVKTEQVEQKVNPYEKNWKNKLIKTKKAVLRLIKSLWRQGVMKENLGKNW